MEGLSKNYLQGEDRKVLALDKINLEIMKGEFVAIVGPSGSGKSTFLYVAGLLTSIDSGRMFLRGRDVSSLDENQRAALRGREIGFVFQEFYLVPSMTALENVTLPLFYQPERRKRARDKAAEILARLGLRKRIDHFPRQLSGGERQRVAIARALVTSPGLILADEPTGNLDSVSGSEVMTLLGEINKKGITILMVTHDMDAAACAGTILHMKNGKLF